MSRTLDPQLARDWARDFFERDATTAALVDALASTISDAFRHGFESGRGEAASAQATSAAQDAELAQARAELRTVYANLTETQARCTALLEELRAARAVLARRDLTAPLPARSDGLPPPPSENLAQGGSPLGGPSDRYPAGVRAGLEQAAAYAQRTGYHGLASDLRASVAEGR